jgi:hypothetical protein
MGVGSRFVQARSAGLKAQFGGRMGGGVSIVMDPSGAELASGLERWAARVNDFSEAWPHAIKLIHAHNKRTFDSEGSATGDGRRWAALTPNYARRKAREYPGQPLLVRTSALRSALTGVGSGSRTRSTKKGLEVGASGRNARIGRYHQFGTPNMVARPPVKFRRDLRDKSSLAWVISQMLQRVIVDHRKAALGAAADVMDVEVADRRTASLERLSRLKTR